MHVCINNDALRWLPYVTALSGKKILLRNVRTGLLNGVTKLWFSTSVLWSL